MFIIFYLSIRQTNQRRLCKLQSEIYKPRASKLFPEKYA